ncbi:SecY stabilizing membrane protein [Granulibacter bethesdensis]|uniref:Bax inhibitor-1/YccA family protein n=1 Tax=Granulibacter bethesdensis TaxID=364410 RepID=UPI00090BD25B|nr:Bax inhibitor-1/YccA family protein [Granulibacter bethesdensis]APH56172.1 SecY stabilizing membrane protein [Granulibacter bethesdensis]
MAFRPDNSVRPGVWGAADTASMDAGLRAYMLRVFNWMASGVALTGIVAYAIAHTSLINAFYHPVMTEQGVSIQPTALAFISMISPLAFVLVLSFGINRLSLGTVQALFWLLCVAMGASLTNIFLVYTNASIVQTFFVSAATFAAMSLYGYTTRSDLTRLGSFLMMGLIGIVIASVVNLFVHSGMMGFVISVIGVLVFTGLTAYDTQRIKVDYAQFATQGGSDFAARRSVFDALQLYLNFINLFMMLLRLLGNRASND